MLNADRLCPSDRSLRWHLWRKPSLSTVLLAAIIVVVVEGWRRRERTGEKYACHKSIQVVIVFPLLMKSTDDYLNGKSNWIVRWTGVGKPCYIIRQKATKPQKPQRDEDGMDSVDGRKAYRTGEKWEVRERAASESDSVRWTFVTNQEKNYLKCRNDAKREKFIDQQGIIRHWICDSNNSQTWTFDILRPSEETNQASLTYGEVHAPKLV